jgi:hypothetical protein
MRNARRVTMIGVLLCGVLILTKFLRSSAPILDQMPRPTVSIPRSSGGIRYTGTQISLTLQSGSQVGVGA